MKLTPIEKFQKEFGADTSFEKYFNDKVRSEDCVDENGYITIDPKHTNKLLDYIKYLEENFNDKAS